MEQQKNNKKEPVYDLIDIEKIKALMRQEGMDAETLAQKAGISPRTVCRLLNGADQRYLSIKIPLNIARVLNIPLDDIVLTSKALDKYRKGE